MVRVWDDQHLEVFVGRDQRVDHAQGQRRVDVVVHLPVDQQELALEVSGQPDVVLMGIDLLVEQPNPGFTPQRDVPQIVVVPRR